VDLKHLLAILKDNTGPGQLSGILDRDNVVMARTEGFQDRIGKPASTRFTDQIKGTDGFWRGVNVQGYTIRLAYTKSKLTGNDFARRRRR
jgi:hypothetical protein